MDIPIGFGAPKGAFEALASKPENCPEPEVHGASLTGRIPGRLLFTFAIVLDASGAAPRASRPPPPKIAAGGGPGIAAECGNSAEPK